MDNKIPGFKHFENLSNIVEKINSNNKDNFPNEINNLLNPSQNNEKPIKNNRQKHGFLITPDQIYDLPNNNMTNKIQ